MALIIAVFLLAGASGLAGQNGDFDGSGQVGLSDFFLFADHYGQGRGEEPVPFDLDGDGQVGFNDFFRFAYFFPGPPPLAPHSAQQLKTALEQLPQRSGQRPDITFRIPHLQLDQIAPAPLYDQLAISVANLPGLRVEPIQLAELGQGWYLTPGDEGGPDRQRFTDEGSFGHLHSRSQGSMHLLLPMDLFRQIIAPRGWGIIHPYSAVKGVGTEHADYTMVFAPHTHADLEAIWVIVQAAYAYSTGNLPAIDLPSP